MRVVKKINNNVAVCVDNNNHELIAFGKGISFPEIPYELNDLSIIQRTFYGVNESCIDLLKKIPEDILGIAAKIVDLARAKIDIEMNPNIVFTLADHIQFALQRNETYMNTKMPFTHEIEHFYELEMEVAKEAVRYINAKKNVTLPYEEVFGIAFHFINAERIRRDVNQEIDDEKIVEDVTHIIEEELWLQIDKSGFNYSRFVSHIYYLLKRKNTNTQMSTDNLKIFESMKEEFPSIYKCVYTIKIYLSSSLDWDINEEELMYLMLHVNRLCSRLDSN